MKCEKCGVDIPAGDEYQHDGKTVCEVCLAAVKKNPRGCGEARRE